MAAPPRSTDRTAEPALDVLVLVPRQDDTDFLIREVQRTRARVQQCWPMPDPFPEADIVFAEIAPGLPTRLPWLPGAAKAALVGIIPRTPVDLELLKSCAADAVLHRPFEAQAIRVSLAQAWNRFGYEQRLRARIDKLDETLRTVRIVERAKAILVRARNIGEDEAYHVIRRQAMERRLSVGAVAEAIVDSQEIIG